MIVKMAPRLDFVRLQAPLGVVLVEPLRVAAG